MESWLLLALCGEFQLAKKGIEKGEHHVLNLQAVSLKLGKGELFILP